MNPGEESAPAYSGRFSVVVPLYNKQDFIERAVASVLSQTFGEFELIIVDDGSTDESLRRLESVSDPRLRIVRQENAGVGAARNRGLQESAGEWVALLDADDYWFPDHLAEMAKIIAAHPAAGMVATSYMEGSDSRAQQPLQTNVRIGEIDYLAAAARMIGIIWSSAVALRREVALRVGGFGSFGNGEDLEYWMRMALAAPVAKSSRVTAYYFRNDQSVMAQRRREGGSSPPPTVFDLWPPVRFLEGVKDAPQHAHLRAAIERYQRRAAYISMAGFLVQGEVGNARAVARSMPGRKVDRPALLALGTRLPAPLIRLAFRLRARLRRRRAFAGGAEL